MTWSAADAQKAPDSEGPDISGVWWANIYSPKIAAIGRRTAVHACRKAATEKYGGPRTDRWRTPRARFARPESPALLDRYPFELIRRASGSLVYLRNEPRHSAVDMTSAPESVKVWRFPYYDGHPAGWEGDTGDSTAGFRKTCIDATGAPHSDEMHVTERLRKINGGRQLEDVATIQDPKNYTKPWSARFVYDFHPELRLEAYVCGEAHRDLSKVKGVRGF
jgi:hypothetical protein